MTTVTNCFCIVGILAGLRPCGVIVMLSELFTSESKAQVYAYLHDLFLQYPINLVSIEFTVFPHLILPLYLEFICYDDGCHLQRYARHISRKDLTGTTKRLAQIEILVNKLHMRGHTDPWCKANCDASAFSELDKVRIIYNITAITYVYANLRR